MSSAFLRQNPPLLRRLSHSCCLLGAGLEVGLGSRLGAWRWGLGAGVMCSRRHKTPRHVLWCRHHIGGRRRHRARAPSTARPLARGPRVLIGWPLPLGFGLGGCLPLARRGRVYVYFTISHQHHHHLFPSLPYSGGF